jgi:glycosyltransferase involved in cell wall biosynthesis
MVSLTIGMATYDDYDGVYFTVEALRLYHDLDNTELIVVDNYGCSATQNLIEKSIHGRYVLETETVGTAFPRDKIFELARGEYVLCCDCHVLLIPGAVTRLKQFFAARPRSVDLFQGPLLYDDGETICTHFEPEWRDQMWGVWATDDRGHDIDAEPFEIRMQGLGVFACRRAAWPGFHPGFRGFGGEEGYIHEKFRARGGKCYCLPWLRWVHRFYPPGRVVYAMRLEDRVRNYLIGHLELGLDVTPVIQHFKQYVPEDTISSLFVEASATFPRIGT